MAPFVDVVNTPIGGELNCFYGWLRIMLTGVRSVRVFPAERWVVVVGCCP
jgi:hypothetical protein